MIKPMTFLTKQKTSYFWKNYLFSPGLKSRSLSYDSQTEKIPLKPKRKYIVQDINGNKIQNVEKYRILLLLKSWGVYLKCCLCRCGAVFDHLT